MTELLLSLALMCFGILIYLLRHDRRVVNLLALAMMILSLGNLLLTILKMTK